MIVESTFRMALSLALAGTSSAPSSLHVYRDWIVGCDNGRDCTAVGLLPRDGSDFGIIEITRTAAATGMLEVELLEAPAGTAVVIAGEVRLAVRPDKNGEVAIGAAELPALLPALRDAAELQLADRDGNVLGHVSLAGASAALLYMDEAQHRVGTVTALARPGSLPASAVPLPPALPEVKKSSASTKPPASFGPRMAARLRGDDACKADAGRRDDPPTFVRLDAIHTLAWVPTNCVSGEYNILGTAYVIIDGGAGEPAPAEFGNFPGGHREGDDTSSANLSWDAKAGVLHTGMLGRGMGDCGLWHDYVWDGRRFEPVEQSEMGECRGGMDAITTWRAKAVSEHAVSINGKHSRS